MWFSAIVGALGFAIAPNHLPFALQWCCLWFGMAIFYVGAQRRFPGFVPLPPPASLKDLGIPDAMLGGAPASPWYLLIPIVTTWLCVAAVPLMVPNVSLIGYGIGIALTLLATAAWLWQRQRGPVKFAKRLLRPIEPGERKLIGVVRNDQPALIRETFWFLLAGEHRDGDEVTPTLSSCGYRQEQRAPIELSVEGETAMIDTSIIVWAAPVEPLRSAPVLRDRSHLGWTMGGPLIRSGRAWEREAISRGQRVVAVGVWDPAARRLSGTAERPAVLFGLGGDRDPVAALRKQLLLRRWPIAALVLLAVLALAVAIIMGPAPEPTARPRPLDQPTPSAQP